MRISILTLFPEMVRHALEYSIVGKAIQRNLAVVDVVPIRDFATDKHHTTDEPPYGGSAGMVLKVDVLDRAWQHAVRLHMQGQSLPQQPKTILMSPQGKLFDQELSKTMIQEQRQNGLILVCGHYEGVDERFLELRVDEELSIGDYVLTGGEYPALVVTDVLVRQIPGVVGDFSSIAHDSLYEGLLKAPVYTRPREYEGLVVPEILTSGHHAKIQEWSHEQAISRTKEKRPDLWEKYQETKQQQKNNTPLK